MKPLLVVKLEKAYAKYAAVRDSHPSTAVTAPAAAATATTVDTADASTSTDGEVKPVVETQPVIPAAPPLSPTKKVEHEKKLRASQHIYHKFLKLASTTLSEREILMCPPPVITEIRSRKHRVRIFFFSQ